MNYWKADAQEDRLRELTAESVELKDAPLRRDVRSLGKLLGDVIREQEGDALFEAVEELRLLAIEHRENEDQDESMGRAERIVDGMQLTYEKKHDRYWRLVLV